MKSIALGVAKTVIGLLVFGLFALATAWPTKWMVNYVFSPSALMAVFGVSQLTFWKAFWLGWLCAGLIRNSSGGSTNERTK